MISEQRSRELYAQGYRVMFRWEHNPSGRSWFIKTPAGLVIVPSADGAICKPADELRPFDGWMLPEYDCFIGKTYKGMNMRDELERQTPSNLVIRKILSYLRGAETGSEAADER